MNEKDPFQTTAQLIAWARENLGLPRSDAEAQADAEMHRRADASLDEQEREAWRLQERRSAALADVPPFGAWADEDDEADSRSAEDDAKNPKEE